MQNEQRTSEIEAFLLPSNGFIVHPSSFIEFDFPLSQLAKSTAART